VDGVAENGYLRAVFNGDLTDDLTRAVYAGASPVRYSDIGRPASSPSIRARGRAKSSCTQVSASRVERVDARGRPADEEQAGIPG